MSDEMVKGGEVAGARADVAREDGRRAANEALFRTVVERISRGEYEQLRDCMTDDLVFELPYGPKSMPQRFEGVEPWVQMSLATFGMFREFSLEITELHPSLDPDELVAEYRSRADVVHNGNEYRNRYIGVLRFRDGRICAWREFHNPDATKVLR